jgi:hemolysin III
MFDGHSGARLESLTCCVIVRLGWTVNLRGSWGLGMARILFRVWFVEHFSILSTAVYVVMGWLPLVAVKPMLLRIPHSGLLWLLAGGVLYTAGVVFYAWKKVPYNHAI